MTAGLPTISPLPPPNWNRSLFDWIIKSSITFVWLFVVRAENAMMGGVQCFLSPPKPSSTSCSRDRNWNWTLFNWAGELSTPKLKPRRLNKITVMEISQSINHFRVQWLFKMRRLKVKTQHDIPAPSIFMKQMDILSVGKLTNLWCDQYAVGPEDN